MTQDEIIAMWDEVVKYAPSEVRITEFAKLVAAHEREAIANVFQEMTKNGHPYMIRMTNAIATIIRARGEA